MKRVGLKQMGHNIPFKSRLYNFRDIEQTAKQLSLKDRTPCLVQKIKFKNSKDAYQQKKVIEKNKEI